MHRTRNLVCALACTATTLLASGALTSQAYGRDRAQGWAIAVFIHGVSARVIARMCVRGLPAYQQRFDDLYARWFEKCRDSIARGEADLNSAL